MNETSAPFKPADHPISGFYQPEPVPARGEYIAWVVLLIFVVTSGILVWRTESISFWVLFFTIAMAIISAAIRFGRWMEANTRIELSRGVICHSTPIRKTEMRWEHLEELSAVPAGSGWMIQVVGRRSAFRFRTATELHGPGDEILTTGFLAGEEIVEQILLNSTFSAASSAGAGWVWRAG